MKLKDIMETVYGDSGFTVEGVLNSEEVSLLVNEITSQWLDRILQIAPEAHAAFSAAGLGNYHTFAHLVDHKELWPKIHRILPQSAVKKFRDTGLFRILEEVFGQIEISREENVGWEEVYWRIVRPHESDDVAPLHADAWFWVLGCGDMPTGKDRIKVWLPIITEPGANNLLLVPGSHRKEWNHSSEIRDGMIKPVWGDNPDLSKPIMADCKSGDAVIFHDKLIHGGQVNRGEKTRISLEFTIFVDSEIIGANV